ncbi:MAG: carboxymuconolactone decarboxylase family protein [Gemmatimonadetes bacterium]|nr:carboxymuconolactone decarboxylase family protein [Gemmatimonadota bacterium]
MPTVASDGIVALDPRAAALIRLSARIARGGEEAMRQGCIECVGAQVPVQWVEELLLQSYLFCGFPRTLNATREWRRISGVVAPVASPGATRDPAASGAEYERWRAQGEATCAIVYGGFYAKLRHNIVALHPELDEWMIVEGYGKILSRPGLALPLRELCIVAACVAASQERQLHSHLHGSLNAGVPAAEVRQSLQALNGVVADDDLLRAGLLLDRVLGKS